VYWDALVEHREEMDELYPEGWYFIHDNHRAHEAVKEQMEEEEFGHIPFPTYSPDLRIYGRHSSIAWPKRLQRIRVALSNASLEAGKL